MKNAIKKTRFLIITIALLIAVPAMAQQVIQTRYYATPWGPMFSSIDECRVAGAMPDMQTLDSNRDGRISNQEFDRAGGADSSVSLFYSIDRNKDGYVSKSELDAYTQVGKCHEVR